MAKVTKVHKTVSLVVRGAVQPGRRFGTQPDDMTLIAVQPLSSMLKDWWKSYEDETEQALYVLPHVSTRDGSLDYMAEDVGVYVEVDVVG